MTEGRKGKKTKRYKKKCSYCVTLSDICVVCVKPAFQKLCLCAWLPFADINSRKTLDCKCFWKTFSFILSTFLPAQTKHFLSKHDGPNPMCTRKYKHWKNQKPKLFKNRSILILTGGHCSVFTVFTISAGGCGFVFALLGHRCMIKSGQVPHLTFFQEQVGWDPQLGEPDQTKAS